MFKGTLIMITSLASLTFLSSCSQDGSSKAVDQSGRCTQAFISDYNSTLSELKTLVYLNSAAQIQTSVNACNKFFTSYGDVSCKAEVDYKEKQISSNDLKTACDEAKKLK